MTDAIQKAREALREMIYETTHLSPEEADGAHKCIIPARALSNARSALAALDAETEVKVLHGPYGWLIKPHGYLLKPIGLNEEYWTLSTEPSEFPADVVSVPLFAREPQMPGDEAPEKRVATVGQEWLIARLKEALKPLAQYADWYERIYGVNCDDGREVPCRMAHLRRARDVSSHVPALDAETPATPADVGEEPVIWQVRDYAGTWVEEDADMLDVRRAQGHAVRPLYSATALEQVTRERDEARATLDEVCLSSRQEWQRATSTEAKLAEARKVIERFSNGDVDVSGTAIIVGYPEARALWTDARRWLEETK